MAIRITEDQWKKLRDEAYTREQLRQLGTAANNFRNKYADDYLQQTWRSPTELDEYYKAIEDQYSRLGSIRNYYAGQGQDVSQYDEAIKNYQSTLNDKSAVYDYFGRYNSLDQWNDMMRITGAKNNSDFVQNSSVNEDSNWDTYRAINGITKIMPVVKANPDGTTFISYEDPMTESTKTNSALYAHMTPEEKQLFNYLENTGNRKDASQYLEYLVPELTARMSGAASDFAKDNKLLGSGLSIVTNLASAIEQPGRMITGGQNVYSNITSSLRSGASSDMGNVGSFFYNTGMSAVDSALAAMMGGGIGEAMLGLSAAANTQNDILRRGGTKEQAVVGGLAAGVAESFFEHFSIGELSKMKARDLTSSFKAFTKNAAKEIAINASEEAATEVANILSDALIMGELSNFNTLVEQYGYEEAILKTIHQIGEAAASGALMGFGFSAGGAAVTAPANYATGSAVTKNAMLYDRLNQQGATLSLDVDNKKTAEARNLYSAIQGYNEAQQKGKKIGKLKTAQHRTNVGTFANMRAYDTDVQEALKKLNTGAKQNVSETVKTAEKVSKEANISKGNAEVTKSAMPQIVKAEGQELSQIYIEKDGNMVSLDKVAIEDADLAAAYSYAVTTGSVENANSFLKSYALSTTNASPTAFWSAWMGIAANGQTLKTTEENQAKVFAEYGDIIGDDAKLAAWLSGVTMKQTASERRTKAAEQARAEWEKGGKKVTKAKIDATELQNVELDAKQKEFVAFGRLFAEAFGINVNFVASKKGNRGDNGKYNRTTNTITLDVFAGIGNDANYNAVQSALANTLSHEVVHNMRIVTPEVYDTLSEYVFETLKAQGMDIESRIQYYIDDAKKDNENMSREDAIEEIVAHACDGMLQTSETVREFMEGFYAKDKRAANRFTQAVKDVLKRLKQVFESLLGVKAYSAEANLLYKAGADSVAEIQKIFDQGIANLREGNLARNYEIANKENSKDQNSEVVYSLRKYSEQQKENWKNAKRIVIYENESQFRDFVKKSRSDKDYNKKIYFGAVSPELATVIKAETGIDVENFNCSLSAYEIRKIFKDHGDGAKEVPRGQRAITESDIMDIPIVIQSPEKIILSDKLYEGKPVIEFSKQTNGILTIAAVVSNKHLDLFVQTAYAKIKKGNLSTPIGEQAPINTPLASGGTVSNNRISQKSQEVNTSGEKISEEMKQSRRDTDYLTAVENGDMETAQKMVDEAAKRAGYTDKLYHGTKKFGFTEFDPSYSDDKISIFVTASNKLAQTYSGRSGVKSISSIANVDTMSIEDVVKNLSKEAREAYDDSELKTEYELLDKENIMKIFADVDSSIESFQGDIENKIKLYADKMALDFNDKDEKIHRNLVRLNEMLEYYEYDSISTPLYMLINHTDALSDIKGVAELEYKIRLRNKLSRVDIERDVVVEKDWDGYSISVLTLDEARTALKDRLAEGNYALYGNPINQLVINGNGRNWNDIRNWTKYVQYTKENTDIEKKGDYWRLYDKAGNEIFHGRIAINDNNKSLDEAQMHYVSVLKANNNLDIRAEYMHTTREIARFAKERGYESVKFENIVDNGGIGESTGAGDVYAYFSPNNLKSADPVTYDDNGNVIPLSKRFNTEEEDIRYSKRISTPDPSTLLKEVIRNKVGAKEYGQYTESLKKYQDLDVRSRNQEKRIADIDAEISKLRSEHKQSGKGTRMDELYRMRKTAENKVSEYQRQMFALEARELSGIVRAETEKARLETQRKANERYHATVKSRRMTERRNRLRKIIKELDTLFNRGNKKKNVKAGLANTVETALRLSQTLAFADIGNDEVILANMITSQTDSEQKVIDKYQDVLNERNALIEELDALEDMEDDATKQKAKELKDKISKLNHTKKELADSIRDLLDREKRILSKTKLGAILQELHTAYSDLQNAEESFIRQAYSDIVASRIEKAAKELDMVFLKDMTEQQLDDVIGIYNGVLKTVKSANKAFVSEKGETYSNLAEETKAEIRRNGKEQDKEGLLKPLTRKFFLNNAIPVWFFDNLYSKTLIKLFNNIADAEGEWGRIIEDGKSYRLSLEKKYGVKEWDVDKTFSFKLRSGKTLELNLGQIMTLYAYAKQGDEAKGHLFNGGVVYAKSIILKDGTKKNKKYIVRPGSTFRLSEEVLTKMFSVMEKEAPKSSQYIDEMVAYLSGDLAEKGNDVAEKLYGIRLFNKKYYFPIRSSSDFIKAKEQKSAGQSPRLKNWGATNERVPNATNPIVLDNFLDVWSHHVNEMASFATFTLPLEDMERVIDFSTRADPNDEANTAESVKGVISTVYGREYVDYIDKLIDHLNGGARVDNVTGFANTFMGLAKTGATALSTSTLIQQPTSIFRAMAFIHPKYFVQARAKLKGHTAEWAELKKYAPIAILKEMGGYDTGLGAKTTQYLKGTEYNGISEKAVGFIKDSSYRNEVIFRAPALADEITWCQIWAAVKKEVADKNKALTVGSEAYYKACGERFTDVVRHTQVYDSVLARSPIMRSKDFGAKMVTAFAAEPTVSINIYNAAVVAAKHGEKTKAVALVSANVASMIACAIVSSFVYAARDDDEDETYTEKYLQSLVTEILEGINPITYLPLLRDVWFIMQGYDIERLDVSIISDAWKAIEGLTSSRRTPWQKIRDFLGTLSQLFGLPLKNLFRESEAIINLFKMMADYASGEHTNIEGIIDSLVDAGEQSIPLLEKFLPND